MLNVSSMSKLRSWISNTCIITQLVMVQAFVAAVPTYQWRDAKSGETVTCNQCPPGTFVKEHCSKVAQTVCSPCPELHYTEYWNYLEKCRYCNVFCGERQLETQQCSSKHNRVCECQSGYYLNFEFCIRHTHCPAGSGVAEPGTAYKDTVCQQCPKGFFSSVSSSTEPCQPHRNCSEPGQETNIPGDSHHDTLCTSCKKYKATADCNQALLEFVAYQKMPQRKVKRFLHVLGKAVKRNIDDSKTHINEMLLLNHLSHWRKTVFEESLLESLLELLRKAKLHRSEQSVQRRFL